MGERVDVGPSRNVQAGQGGFIPVDGPAVSAFQRLLASKSEPFPRFLERTHTLLDAAPIKGWAFIAKHTRNADACEREIANGSGTTTG